MLFSRADS